ncbi:MAG TPA: type II toxin-antitoxin system VapC family toxin [Solirubrobacteraceae bacterium]|nr:type II toxin-antitoxin system VapC family toxin [Solirubrobacteraceae bacterium]
MLVVDSSAILEAFATVDPPARLLERLATDASLHAPHLIDTEVLSVLRRMTIHETIGAERAELARADFDDLGLIRYPHQPLSSRVWELRHNLSAYDATFVALAEALSAPLVTCDRRLASATGHRAEVELFAVARA